MTEWNLFSLLAQNGNPPENPGPWSFMLPMVAILVLWYFLLLRPQSRDRKRRDEMINTLKKNDRVATIGGIIGSVASISNDGREVTLKVDDNTRIKFLKSSIQTVLGEESKPDAS